MLLSRFWFLTLAALATLGLAMALLARGAINRGEVAEVDDHLRRDRFELESLLKLDARARIDAIAPIAADGDVRSAVQGKKVSGQSADKALLKRLRSMNRQLDEMRADLLVAVNADGVIVAQEGRRQPRSGAGLGKVPLVTAALSGYLGDDVWVYDDQVYRVAARPVIDHGQYVGAIVHCQKLDSTLAQRLSERLGGPTIAFFRGEKVLASHTPNDVQFAITQAELTPSLPPALTDERLKRGERTEAIDLEDRGRATFSLVAGSASAADVGYAIARPYHLLATPWAIFDYATKEDIEALPKLWLFVGLFGAFALAMGTMYLERDRPLHTLREQVAQMSEGKSEELDLPALSRAHRKVGEDIHKAIEVMVAKGGGSRAKQKANLDEILGPTPESLTSSAFSFGGDPEDQAPSAAAPPPMPAPGRTGAGEPMPMPMPMPMPAPPARPGAGEPPAAPAARASTPMAAPPLPLKAPEAPKPTPPPQITPASQGDDEQAHFREVYDQYVDLRAQCGESKEVPFEKFQASLKKNRDTILAGRKDASGVRFSAYVKDGKAAIKAAPVKA